MPDSFPTDEATSERMRRIGQKNTKPERMVASFLHRKGLRFRKNYKSLPGKPDLAFPKYKTAIFVHGCYWHNHSCRAGRLPTRNHDLWAEKMERNKARDQMKEKAIIESGWRVFTIWECELKDKSQVEKNLENLYSKIINDQSS